MLASAHAEQGVLCKACSYSLAKAAEGVASKQNQRKKYKIIIILYFLNKINNPRIVILNLNL